MKHDFHSIHELNPDFGGSDLGLHRSLSSSPGEEALHVGLSDSGKFQVELVPTPDGWVIRDLDSSTGACVGETLIESGR
jgi:hypothetical protein